MTVLTRSILGQTVTLTQQMASSGEGTVWKTNLKGYIAKIYHTPTPERIKKLQIMVSHPPWDPMRNHNHITFAWPQDLLQNSQGNYVGFLMPLIGESVKLSTIYNPRLRSRKAPRFNWYYLHTTALNIALALQSLHREGYVVGDIKPQNLLVNNQALVSIIDTDSFQVPNPYTREVHRCLVGSEGFTPPELLGKDLSTLDQTEVHDRFRLAVTIYLLLFGDQPFKGKWIGQGESPQPMDLIRQGFWPYAPKSLIRPGPHTIPLSVVHPDIQKLFHQCFTQGHQKPDARPTAETWVRGLQSAIAKLTTCKLESNHRYSRTYGQCYWCDRKTTLGTDIFSPHPTIPNRLKAKTRWQPTALRSPNLRIPRPSRLIYTAQVHSSTVQPLPSFSGSPTSSPNSPLLQKWLPSLSNTVIGGALCALSLLGLGLLLLPAEIDIAQLNPWSSPLGNTLGQGIPSSRKGLNTTTVSINSAATSSSLDPTPSLPRLTNPSRTGHWDAVTTLAISPDSKTLVSGSRDFTIKIWDLATGTLVRTLSEHYEPIISVSIPEQGNTLISSSSAGKIILWDLQTGKPLQYLGETSKWGSRGAIRSAVTNSKGTFMATSGWGGKIQFRHLQTARVTEVASDSLASEQAIAISPDTKTVVSSSSDGNIKLWDVQTNTLHRSFPDPQTWELSAFTNSLAMSSDGELLVSGGWDGSIVVWNMQTGQRLATFRGHEKFISALIISTDNSLVVSGSDDHLIKIWDIHTGQLVRTLQGHQDSILTLAESRNGQFLVSGSEDQTIKIWHLNSGELLHTLPSQ